MLDMQILKEKQLKRQNRLLDIEYLVDNFDTLNGGDIEDNKNYNYFGKVTIASMVMIAHAYIMKAGSIPEDCKLALLHNFPTVKKCEWLDLAREIKAFYLGSDCNHPMYKFNYNKYVVIYNEFKERNNKYNDLKIN